jgi:hypothetical protein
MDQVFFCLGYTIYREIANSFRSCRKQSTSDFWDHIAKQESQQRQDEQLMEKRKRDIRRQNVDQLRIDGDAMTKELDKELNGRRRSVIAHICYVRLLLCFSHTYYGMYR